MANYRDISKSFSVEALQSIYDACEYASKKNLRVCSVYHLLHVILKNERIERMCQQLGINIEALQAQIAPQESNASLPFSMQEGVVFFGPSLRETLLQAYLFSKKISTQMVEIEDIFYASLQYKGIVPIVKKLAIPLDELEGVITSITGGVTPSGPDTGRVLQRFTRDLVAAARSGELETIVNRTGELAQLTRILTRKSKNNVILLGENGVGRSSIMHLLASKVASGEIAHQLKDTSILELNLSGIVTALAARNVGEFSDLLLEELMAKGEVILFIKDFGAITDEGTIEKALSANILKTLLSSRDIRFVGVMNSTSYRKLAAKEHSIAERFETVKVSEPSVELAIQILEQVAKRLSAYHNITIGKAVVEVCVTLSKRYIQDKFLPSKAVDLLDEASSKVALENRKEITVEDIRAVVSEKTGIPIEKVNLSEQKKLVDLEEILNKVVIGQTEAVHVVSEVIRRSRAGLKDPNKPIGSFLFLGPSGVGKTYLAQNLARIVYDSESAMIRLDMSEFSESHTVQRLIGSPPGYVGYEEGGQLTNPVWERPYSLILLDEIEKAHPKVFDMFLQVLDEGRLTDGQGRTVDFKNTIIIATSNIASTEILEKLQDDTGQKQGFEREKFYEEEILPLLKTHFRPEFVNRFDEIVVFNPLGVEVLKVIARLQIQKIQKRLQDKKITLVVSDEKIQEFAQNSYNPAFGARPLIRLIQEKIENMLARKIISGEIKEGETVKL